MKPKTYPREMLSAFVISAGGVSKVRFDESRCYFHFGIPALRLGIDIDSGFIGRHNWKRHNRATALGWYYFKFTAAEIRAGIAEKMIGEFIDSKIAAPSKEGK
jgi:hypothetical protein